MSDTASEKLVIDEPSVSALTGEAVVTNLSGESASVPAGFETDFEALLNVLEEDIFAPETSRAEPADNSPQAVFTKHPVPIASKVLPSPPGSPESDTDRSDDDVIEIEQDPKPAHERSPVVIEAMVSRLIGFLELGFTGFWPIATTAN
jgi:hypothetical protein